MLQARLEESERDGAKDSEEDFAGILYVGLLISRISSDDTATIPDMVQLCVTCDLTSNLPP